MTLVHASPQGGGSGSSEFTSLTDTPADYTGQALKGVRVNSGETALEYYTPTDENDAAVWGNITGTLGDQTDLQSALDGKQDADSNLDAVSSLGFGAEGRVMSSDGLGGLTMTNASGLRTYLNVEDGADVTDTANVTAAGALMASNNLSDLTSTTTARTNLGVDAAGTDNSTDVTLAGQDYLTISGQEITANKIAIDDLADGTDGELITWDSSGNPTTVAVGTSGQVLTSNGAGSAPTFQDASGGGGSYPLQVYKSSSTACTTGTDYSFTHNLGITEPEIEAGKYDVIALFEDSSNNRSFTYWGGTIYYVQTWTATSPSSTSIVSWQANTVEIQAARTGNLILLVVQLWE